MVASAILIGSFQRGLRSVPPRPRVRGSAAVDAMPRGVKASGNGARGRGRQQATASKQTKKLAPKESVKKSGPQRQVASAKATPQKTSASRTATQDSLAVEPFMSPEAKRRRTEMEAADRALKKKFSHVDPCKLDSLRNAAGVSAAERVLEEMRRVAKKGEYIKSKFWVDLEGEFDLSGQSVFLMLEEPASPEQVNPELCEAILKTVDENPAMRQCEDLEAILAHSGPCNMTEFYGLLFACRPQPNLSLKHREELENMVLNFATLNKLPDAFPELWSIVEGHFEHVLHRRWLASSRAGREEFVEANMHALVYFMDENALLSVEKSLATGTGLPGAKDLRSCMGSVVGASLYAKQGQQMQWLLYIEAIDAGLKQLYFHDFAESEYTAFQQRMKNEIAVLEAAGLKSRMRKDMAVRFFTVPNVTLPLHHAADQWLFQLRSEIKAVLVNSSAVMRFPWERFLYGDDKIEGVAETTRIPDTLTKDIKVCRSAAFKLLGDQACMLSISDCIRCLKPHLKTLEGYDRTWRLDWELLSVHAEPMIWESIEAKVLSAFPQTGSPVSEMQKVADEILSIRDGPQMVALPPSYSQLLTASHSIMVNLIGHEAPDRRTIAKYGPHHLAILQAATVFCTFYDGPSGAAASNAAGKLLWGKPALQKRFQQAKRVYDTDGVDSLDSYAEFRRFSWLLDAEQQKVVDVWVREATKKHRTQFAGPMLADAVNACDKAAGGSSSDGAIVLSSQSKMCIQRARSFAPPVVEPKVAAAANAKTAQKMDAMKRLFGKHAFA